jgi:D-alanyl-D-alanine carboxypeptidase
MKLLSVLLLSTFLLIGGCQNEETSTNDGTKQEENSEMHKDKPMDNDQEKQQTIQRPDYAQIEATLKDRLIQETNSQSVVKDFSTKEALIDYLNNVLATDVAKQYVDRFYIEENDGLYLETQDTPVWLNLDEDFQVNKKSKKEYRVVQHGENQLRGKYKLSITYEYKIEQWRITTRDVKQKGKPLANEENNENSSDENTAPEKKTNQSNDTTNKDDPKHSETNGESKDTEQVVDDPDRILVVVNKNHHLPAGYVPNDLVETPVPFPFEEDLPKKLLRAESASALDDMFQEANSQGLDLFAQSGYRSYNRQEAIFASNVERYGSKKKANQVSAEPGESEHQTGLAMDVTSPAVDYRLIQSFDQTEEGQWVLAHAHEYGFIIRYPKGESSITGYDYEPWHLRYVGKKAANYIQSKQLTLEEYRGLQ